jgi:hypothetical protein
MAFGLFVWDEDPDGAWSCVQDSIVARVWEGEPGDYHYIVRIGHVGSYDGIWHEFYAVKSNRKLSYLEQAQRRALLTALRILRKFRDDYDTLLDHLCEESDTPEATS